MTNDTTHHVILSHKDIAPERSAAHRMDLGPTPSHPLLDILVHIHEDDQEQVRLDAAVQLANKLGADITCVQVTPDISAVAMDPYGGAYYVPELYEAQTKIDESARDRVNAVLADRIRDHDWRHITGHPVQALVQAASLADLLIVSEGRMLAAKAKPKPLAGHLAMAARAPVLVLPEGAALDFSHPVIVAWNNSFEAAQALRFAVPVLTLAAQVEILVVGDDESAPTARDAQSYLARRGIASRINLVHHPIGRTTSSLLMDRIDEIHPSLVVMGAYGHTRALELVFGGVTQSMLENMPAPLLLAH
ncbi:universal stress protein [Sphingomonas oryzagri]